MAIQYKTLKTLLELSKLSNEQKLALAKEANKRESFTTYNGNTVTRVNNITANSNICTTGNGITFGNYSSSTAVLNSDKGIVGECPIEKHKQRVKLFNTFPDHKGKKNIQVCFDSVYILFSKLKIVYIGESINPLARIGAHTKDKVFDSFRVLPTSRRKYWEKVLIRKYKPLYNIHGV